MKVLIDGDGLKSSSELSFKSISGDMPSIDRKLIVGKFDGYRIYDNVKLVSTLTTT